ncbi:MAG: class I SAM-dependent methyltransferase [archaeon]
MNKIKEFYNKNPKSYDLFESRINEFPLLKELREKENNLLKHGAGKKVFYFATGSGFHITQLAKAGAKVFTLDFSEEMIKIACKKLEKEGIEFEVLRGVSSFSKQFLDEKAGKNPKKLLIAVTDMRKVSLPKNYFDYVFCYCTLPLVGKKNIESILKKMLEWSRNGAVSIYRKESLPKLKEYYNKAGFNSWINGESIFIEGGFEYYCANPKEIKGIIEENKKLETIETGLGIIYLWKEK